MGAATHHTSPRCPCGGFAPRAPLKVNQRPPSKSASTLHAVKVTDGPRTKTRLGPLCAPLGAVWARTPYCKKNCGPNRAPIGGTPWDPKNPRCWGSSWFWSQRDLFGFLDPSPMLIRTLRTFLEERIEILEFRLLRFGPSSSLGPQHIFSKGPSRAPVSYTHLTLPTNREV